MCGNPLQCYLHPSIQSGQDTCETIWLFLLGFWRASRSERASEKKTIFLWVLSRLASISVATVFNAIASALKF